jgi:hypothetical protein
MFSNEPGAINKWPEPLRLTPDWCVIANRLLGYLDGLANSNYHVDAKDLGKLKYELGLLPYDAIIMDKPKTNFK